MKPQICFGLPDKMPPGEYDLASHVHAVHSSKNVWEFSDQAIIPISASPQGMNSFGVIIVAIVCFLVGGVLGIYSKEY